MGGLRQRFGQLKPAFFLYWQWSLDTFRFDVCALGKSILFHFLGVPGVSLGEIASLARHHFDEKTWKKKQGSKAECENTHDTEKCAARGGADAWPGNHENDRTQPWWSMVEDAFEMHGADGAEPQQNGHCGVSLEKDRAYSMQACERSCLSATGRGRRDQGNEQLWKKFRCDGSAWSKKTCGRKIEVVTELYQVSKKRKIMVE